MQTVDENLLDDIKQKKASTNCKTKKAEIVELPDDSLQQFDIDEQEKRELSLVKNKELERKRKKPKKLRGEGSDAQKVIKRIKDFDPENSPACIKLNAKFGRGIVHSELKSLAEFICEKLHIELDRDAKRDNRVLYKWFHENWAMIDQIIDRIELFDKDHNVIK